MMSESETSNFDIVKATQYGVFSRVKQLVEEEGHGVNERDSVSEVIVEKYLEKNTYLSKLN